MLFRNQYTSWSQDGEWMYFGSRRSGRWEVWKVSVGGGEPIQVTQDGGQLAFESTDGRFMLYKSISPKVT